MRQFHSFSKLALLIFTISSANLAFGQYNGWFENANCTTLSGWVEDSRIPNTPISADIYDGTTYVTTAVGNIFRQDILNAGYGNGIHVFSIGTPASLLDGRTHSLSARPQGTSASSNLGGSPISITCTPPGAHQYGGSLDGAGCATMGGWAWDASNPNTAVSVSLYVDGSTTAVATVTASAYRADVYAAHYGTGNYGFTIATPASLLDGNNHSVSIRPTATSGEVLYGSPKTINCAPIAHFYRGWLDGADCNTIHGWAADLDNPNVIQTVYVYIDGVQTAQSGSANLSRPDVAAALGTGNYNSYGFSIPTPAVFADKNYHTVQVYVGSPGTGLLLPSSTVFHYACKPTLARYSSAGCSNIYGVVTNYNATWNGQYYPQAAGLEFYLTNPGDSYGVDFSTVVDQMDPTGSYKVVSGFYSNIQNSPLYDPAAPGNPHISYGPITGSNSVHVDLNMNGLDAGSSGGIASKGNYYFGSVGYLNHCGESWSNVNGQNDWGPSQHVTAAVQITSVNPTQLTSGRPTQMTIYGSGFGLSGNVLFSGPSSFSAPYSGGSSTQITIQFNAPATTGTYNLAVQEGVDVGSFSFGPGAVGQPPTSAMVNVLVTQPRIFRDGVDITDDQTVNVVVGQPINLSVQTAGASIVSATWRVPGIFVDGAGWSSSGQPTPSTAISPGYTPTLSGTTAPTYYWVDRGQSRIVTVDLTLAGGATATARATFNVLGPDPSLASAVALGTAGVQILQGSASSRPVKCYYGTTAYPWCAAYGDDSGPEAGWGFNAKTSDLGSYGGFSGEFQWVQIVNLTWATSTGPGLPATNINCNGLDSIGFSVSGYALTDGTSMADAPSNALDAGGYSSSRTDYFVTTLMFRPRFFTDSEGVVNSLAGGIYVPVASTNWFWSYQAFSDDHGASWPLLSNGAANAVAPFSATVVYPTWRVRVQDCLQTRPTWKGTSGRLATK